MGITHGEPERFWLKQRTRSSGKWVPAQSVVDPGSFRGGGVLLRADKVDPLLRIAHHQRRHEATLTRGKLANGRGIGGWCGNARGASAP